MSLGLRHPFTDPTVGLDQNINPFVKRLLEGRTTGELPLEFGPELAHLPGMWRNRFPHSPSELILEIGSHRGDFLNSLANFFPDRGFVGVDITYKRTVVTAEKARLMGNQNVISVLANAQHLNKIFGKHELSGIILFFPDPWSKKRRQRKNRLVDTSFCEQVASILRPDGFLWIKTDEPSYFAEISEKLARCGFQRSAKSQPLAIPTQISKSSFQNHFENMDLPIFESHWYKTYNLKQQNPLT